MLSPYKNVRVIYPFVESLLLIECYMKQDRLLQFSWIEDIPIINTQRQKIKPEWKEGEWRETAGGFPLFCEEEVVKMFWN